MIKKNNKPDLWVVVGVISAGFKDCNKISAFTRVSLYVPWIYDQIRENNLNTPITVHV